MTTEFGFFGEFFPEASWNPKGSVHIILMTYYIVNIMGEGEPYRGMSSRRGSKNPNAHSSVFYIAKQKYWDFNCMIVAVMIFLG